MARSVVVVADPVHPAGIARLEGRSEVICLEADCDRATASRALARADGLIVRLFAVDAAAMDAAPGLKVIGKHGVGVDNIDLAAATERGIVVANTPGLNATAVAEAAVSMMLSVLKCVPAQHRAVVEHRFFEVRNQARLGELTGKTLGVIGAGPAGGKVAQICARGFAMRVLVYDPYIGDDRVAALGAERAPTLRALLAAADVVTVHTPLSDETRSMIDAAALAQMRPSAILINTARGPVVDEAALARALADGKIRGAGLDVFADEPPAADSPLLGLANVVLSPHTAGGTEESLKRLAIGAADAVLDVLAGRRPAGLLNPEVWHRRRR